MRPLLFVLLLCLSAGVQAQSGTERPRLGLVLSGGGARGFAHIGVLQVLEELRVPVDCIAGTSMGSIIGGLYAYGLSPDEIERIVANMDWDYVLQDSPLRTDLAIRRRLEEREFQIHLTIGVRDGSVALPKGLVQGQNLGFVLDQTALQAHDLASFDDLPLPFRCVAADIGDGTRVVFDSGDLPRAMRASMALPGVFAPVEWGGRLLVDGGIIDNLPVEAARSMGAQRLIAVDIGTPPMRREEIQDLLGITSQMVALLTQRFIDDALASLTPQDLLIQPDLGKLTSASFDAGDELVRLGREQALRQAEQLRAYSVPEAEYQAWRARQRRQQAPLPIVTGIEVEGCQDVDPQLIRNRIQQPIGAPLDINALKRSLEKAYGLDLFELLRCRVLYAADGTCVLHIDATEKSWGPGYLRFGLDAGTDFAGGDSFSIGGRYVLTGAGPLGAEWATDLRVGTNTLVRTEWFQPLESERSVFVAPSVGYGRRPVRAPIGNQISTLTEEQAWGAIDIGTHALSGTELRLGIDRGVARYHVDSGLTPPGQDTFDDGGLHLQFVGDTLDRSTFPSSGLLATAEYRWRLTGMGAESDYEVARASLLAVTQVWGQSVALRLGGQFEVAGRVDYVDLAMIGGLFELSGYGNTELVGSESGLASLITYRKLGDASGRLAFPVYVGASAELGGVWRWSNLAEEDVIVAGSLFVGVDSPLGPIFVAYGAAEGGHHAAYFTVGQLRF